jgi:hypothetical protein
MTSSTPSPKDLLHLSEVEAHRFAVFLAERSKIRV